MTPLAHKIINELTLPRSARTFNEAKAPFLKYMTDIHCFEVSAVIDEALNWFDRDSSQRIAMLDVAGFLPAENTWIEWTVEGGRQGVLLTDRGTHARVLTAIHNEPRGLFGVPFEPFDLPLAAKAGSPLQQADRKILIAPGADDLPIQIGAVLTAINSPRIIGRRQHMPHAGLQRKLAAAKGTVGKYPLHAWTEIRLEVHPPEWAGDEEHETYLTGSKAMHFCRKYVRIKNGRLEYVRSHWKGDPSLGIRRSRYTLIQGGKAAPVGEVDQNTP